MKITDEPNRKFSFMAVREQGGKTVKMITGMHVLLHWLDQHDSQLHDKKLYTASDLAATVTRIK